MDRLSVGEVVEKLITTSNRIWHLESDIRKGREGELGLEEVGRRALLIRDLNTERISFINQLNRLLDPEAAPIVKVNHASFRPGE